MSIKPLLSALIAALPSQAQHALGKPQLPPPRVPKDKDATQLVQSQIWPSIEGFLRSGDVVVSETGTSTFGLCDITFPSHTRFEAQMYYGSIGWATAATLGVDVARKELAGDEGRTLLFTGDGSMALTIQEVGTMIRAGSKIVIFVINNAGYTIERLIWGARQRKPTQPSASHQAPFTPHHSNTNPAPQPTMTSSLHPTPTSSPSTNTPPHPRPTTAPPQKQSSTPFSPSLLSSNHRACNWWRWWWTSLTRRGGLRVRLRGAARRRRII